MARQKTGTVDSRHRHFTDAIVKRLPAPAEGDPAIFYRDTAQPGLGLRVTASGVRAFIVETWFAPDGGRGRCRRETIGRIGDFSVDQARERAASIRGQYKRGTDRRVEAKKAEIAAFTLQQALDDYLAFKRDRHKQRTQDDVRDAFTAAFGDWLDRPMLAITEEAVLSRHAERTKQAKRTQKKAGRAATGARADLEFRYFRAVWNFARASKRVDREMAIPEAPTRRLSELDAWNPRNVRTRTVEPAQMTKWLAAVQTLPDGAAPDWLEFLWMTGLRSSESRELLWKDVDLERGAMLFVDTKNRAALELPITPAVRAILDRRAAARVNDYVFPSSDRKGHLSDSTQAVRAVAAAYGRPWGPHDLRAAFITGGMQIRVHPLMVRMLSNHKLPKSDAHARYFRPDLAEKRAAAEDIQRYLMRCAGVGSTATVIEMPIKSRA